MSWGSMAIRPFLADGSKLVIFDSLSMLCSLESNFYSICYFISLSDWKVLVAYEPRFELTRSSAAYTLFSLL